MDTGVFNENRYFDVFMEYAKAAPEDILIKITAWNRGPEEAQLDLLPTLWFRNIWSFGEKHGHPKLWRVPDFMGAAVVAAEESRYGKRWLLAEGAPEMLFTENETNFQRVFGIPQCNALREGQLPRLSAARRERGRQSRANGHEMRRALSRSRLRRALPRRFGCV